jgi:glycosyltransferase involved in cell wall biosynthesis
MSVAEDRISVVLTTYNRPDALELVLLSLAAQTAAGFEVVVADDGSTADTKTLISSLAPSLPYAVSHVWQDDRGFRAAMARNRAVASARGDYMIFLDGDCVAPADFVRRHAGLAEHGWFVAGNRLLLGEKFTRQAIGNRLPLWSWRVFEWLLPFLRRDVNRVLPMLGLPDGALRKRNRGRWQGAKTCNLAVWRRDVLNVNGFDEQFEGWGHEDAEFVVRLMRSGVGRKEGRFAVPVLHLWHAEQDRGNEATNLARLQAMLSSSAVEAAHGLDKYLT